MALLRQNIPEKQLEHIFMNILQIRKQGLRENEQLCLGSSKIKSQAECQPHLFLTLNLLIDKLHSPEQDPCSLRNPSYRNILEIESVGCMAPTATVQETKIGMGGRKKGFISGCKFPKGENN